MTSNETPTPSPAVLTERREGALIITINRPHVRNAINAEVSNLIAGALDTLESDDDLSVGVLTGAGGYFCAGMDLGAFAGGGESPWHPERGFAGIIERPPRKPLIAAIDGFALAGGLEVALACDLLVAAEGAKLGIPEAKRGLVAAGGGVVRLARRMPYHVVMEMALTGEPMSAERLHDYGLVNRLAAPGQALTEALALARTVSASSPLAVIASKEILEQQSDWSTDELWARQAVFRDRLMASSDAREGATAFKEKRAPVWRGR